MSINLSTIKVKLLTHSGEIIKEYEGVSYFKFLNGVFHIQHWHGTEQIKETEFGKIEIKK